MEKFKAFLLLIGSSPVFRWIIKVGRDSSVTYYTTTMTPFASKAWMVGLVMAVASGLVHGFDVWLQQQTANAPQVSGVSHIAMLKAKMGVFLLFLMALTLLSSPANAWVVKSKKLATPVKMGASLGSLVGAGLDKNGVVLIPTASLGLGLGSIKNSYGFSAAYDVLWCHVKGVDGQSSELTPYLGVGAAVFADLGPWLSSNLGDRPQVKLGINVIGPSIGGIVPGIQEVWDLRTHSRTTIVSWNVPFGLFSNSAIVKLFGL